MKIVCGGDENIFAILVMQLQGLIVLSWNLEENCENEAFDIQNEHSIIFDKYGKIHILTEDDQNSSSKLILSEKLVSTNCF